MSATARDKICWYSSFSSRGNATLQNEDDQAEVSAIEECPLGDRESYRRYLFDDTDKETYMRVKRIRNRYRCSPNENPFRFEASKYERLLKWLPDRDASDEKLPLTINGKACRRLNPTARGLTWNQAVNTAGKLRKIMLAAPE